MSTPGTRQKEPEALHMIEAEEHPKDRLLRRDRLPHIWCPTCGIGTAVSCFIEAVDELDVPRRTTPSCRASDARAGSRGT